jgi:transcriptional antiterminator NusG
MTSSLPTPLEDSTELESTEPLETVSENETDLEQEPENTHNLEWFILVCQSNNEKKVVLSLQERIKKFNLAKSFGRIIIPSQEVEKIDSKGKKSKVEKKITPGYIFIQLEMNDFNYSLVRDTPKVLSFLGATKMKMPPAISYAEINRLLNQAENDTAKPIISSKIRFDKGEKVKVIDGPFTNFIGEVDEVKHDKFKLRLLISVFGRPTPVELEYTKVEKL